MDKLFEALLEDEKDIALVGTENLNIISRDEFAKRLVIAMKKAYQKGYNEALEADFEEKFWEHYSELVQKGEV